MDPGPGPANQTQQTAECAHGTQHKDKVARRTNVLHLQYSSSSSDNGHTDTSSTTNSSTSSDSSDSSGSSSSGSSSSDSSSDSDTVTADSDSDSYSKSKFKKIKLASSNSINASEQKKTRSKRDVRPEKSALVRREKMLHKRKKTLDVSCETQSVDILPSIQTSEKTSQMASTTKHCTSTRKTERRFNELPVRNYHRKTRENAVEGRKYENRIGRRKTYDTNKKLAIVKYGDIECNKGDSYEYSYNCDIDDDEILLLNLCGDEEKVVDSPPSPDSGADITPVRMQSKGATCQPTCCLLQCALEHSQSLADMYRHKHRCDETASMACVMRNNANVCNKEYDGRPMEVRSSAGPVKGDCNMDVIPDISAEIVKDVVIGDNQTADMKKEDNSSLIDCLLKSYVADCYPVSKSENIAEKQHGNTAEKSNKHGFHGDSERNTETPKTECNHSDTIASMKGKEKAPVKSLFRGKLPPWSESKERKPKTEHFRGNTLTRDIKEEDTKPSNMSHREIKEEGKKTCLADSTSSDRDTTNVKSESDCAHGNVSSTSTRENKSKERKSKSVYCFDDTVSIRDSKEAKSRRHCSKDGAPSTRDSKRRKSKTDGVKEKDLQVPSDHRTTLDSCKGDSSSTASRISNTCNQKGRQHDSRADREPSSPESHRTKESRRSSESDRRRKKDIRHKIEAIDETLSERYREHDQTKHKTSSDDWHQGAAHCSSYRHHGRHDRQSQRGVGYCFVNFPSSTAAKNALIRLNGKVLPYSSPPKRFKLNMANFRGPNRFEKEYSVFVGPLGPDVDDYQLYTVFCKKYKSVRSVRVVRTPEGVSRGFGFVRFTSEFELQRAIVEMQDSLEFGYQPIKIRMSVPKDRSNETSSASGTTTTDSYTSYDNKTAPTAPAATPNYSYPPTADYNMWWQQQNAQYYQQYPYCGTVPDPNAMNQCQVVPEEYDEELQDPELEVDVDKLNSEFMKQSEELYTALEECRWHTLEMGGEG